MLVCQILLKLIFFSIFHIKRKRWIWVSFTTVEGIHLPIFFLERWICAKMWRLEVSVSKVWCLLCWKGKFQASKLASPPIMILWKKCVPGRCLWFCESFPQKVIASSMLIQKIIEEGVRILGRTPTQITLERWILFDTYPLVSSTHWKNWRSCCILITVKTHGSSCNYVLYIYLLRSSIYNNMPNLEMRWPSGVRSSCLFFGFGGSYCLEGYRHSETQRDPDGSVGGECDVMLELTQETWGLAPARPKTCSW